jgi:hypothetical protein
MRARQGRRHPRTCIWYVVTSSRRHRRRVYEISELPSPFLTPALRPLASPRSHLTPCRPIVALLGVARPDPSQSSPITLHLHGSTFVCAHAHFVSLRHTSGERSRAERGPGCGVGLGSKTAEDELVDSWRSWQGEAGTNGGDGIGNQGCVSGSRRLVRPWPGFRHD